MEKITTVAGNSVSLLINFLKLPDSLVIVKSDNKYRRSVKTVIKLVDYWQLTTNVTGKFQELIKSPDQFSGVSLFH
jgi:hypothetical protein